MSTDPLSYTHNTYGVGVCTTNRSETEQPTMTVSNETINEVLDETHFNEGARDVAEAFYAPESFDRREVNDLLARGISEVYQRYAPIGGKITTTRFNERIIWTDEYGDHVEVGSYELTISEDAPLEGDEGEHIVELIEQLRGYVIREATDVLGRAERESINREVSC